MLNEFFYLNNIDVENLTGQQKIIFDEVNQEYKVPINEEKYMKRFDRVKKEKTTEIFEKGKFNMELYQYILEEYMDKRLKEKEEKRQQAEESFQSDNLSNPINKKGLFNTGYATNILGFIMFASTGYMAYLTYQSSSLFNF